MLANIGIFSGHALLADWLFLIAALLFVLAGLIAATQNPDKSRGSLIPAGLALVALAWLVL
jgi:hypothetical protein